MSLLTLLSVVLLSVPVSIEVDTSDFRLAEVVVTANHHHGTRLSSVSSVEVDATSLTAELQGSLAKGLDAIAGVQASAIGSGQSRPAIRGLGFNRLAIIHDGIRHEGQQWGDDHGLEIDRGKTSETIDLKIAVPADVAEGDYHFMLRLTDRAGWQTINAVAIHLHRQTE